MSPDDPVYDEDHCGHCGKQLPALVISYTWQDHGYCSFSCCMASGERLQLQGPPAIEVARAPGALGGPGFEADIVKQWLQAGSSRHAPAFLLRRKPIDLWPEATNHPDDTWVWHLWAGGKAVAMRLTRKKTP